MRRNAAIFASAAYSAASIALQSAIPLTALPLYAVFVSCSVERCISPPVSVHFGAILPETLSSMPLSLFLPSMTAVGCGSPV